MLNLETIENKYFKELKSIRNHLREEADLLIYGCEFGNGIAGSNVIEQISNITGADIAASTNITGAAGLRGDWYLETKHGQIETGITFNSNILKGWNYSLGIVGTIGIAKSISGSPGLDINDNVIVTYLYIIENHGLLPVFEVQIEEDLSGVFGTFVPGTPTNPGEYTISLGPTIVFQSGILNPLLALVENPNYTGTAPETGLLDDCVDCLLDTLEPGAVALISLTVIFRTDNFGQTFLNQATATAQFLDIIPLPTSDLSDNGLITDTDGDGDPNEGNNTNTPPCPSTVAQMDVKMIPLR